MTIPPDVEPLPRMPAMSGNQSRLRLIGLSPDRVFSGFERTFFDAVAAQGAAITRIPVEIPWLKGLCTLTSFYPGRKRWATRRDRHYHTSIASFRLKSGLAHRSILARQSGADAIYQIGGLWNPAGSGLRIPLILQVDYTSRLSKERRSEWMRRPGRHERFWFEQENRLYRDAALVLTTTENARRSLIRDYGVPPAHAVTVGCGVSPPYDTLEAGRTPAWDSRRVLFVGKGYHGKGLDTLLEAFQEVRRRVPGARLTVVGPTGMDIGGDGVEYLGRISDKERVRNLYYEHALFAMPSRFEPVGQVFLEAMSAQLPCIGTTLDAMPELIEHGRTGYVIQPGDAQALAEHIAEIIADPGRTEALGRAGFRHLVKNYTWPVVGDKIANSICKIL